MIWRLATLLFIALTASPAFASDFIDTVSGVYKKTHPNGIMDGGKVKEFKSQDILEIVRTGDNTAYVRYALTFFNGHVCNLAGIARQKDDGLVYEDARPQDNGAVCKLKLHIEGKNLVTREISTAKDGYPPCQYYCGMRGRMDETSFLLSAKRKIRYMPRLKASTEFKEAVSNYEKEKQH